MFSFISYFGLLQHPRWKHKCVLRHSKHCSANDFKNRLWIKWETLRIEPHPLRLTIAFFGTPQQKEKSLKKSCGKYWKVHKAQPNNKFSIEQIDMWRIRLDYIPTYLWRLRLTNQIQSSSENQRSTAKKIHSFIFIFVYCQLGQRHVVIRISEIKIFSLHPVELSVSYKIRWNLIENKRFKKAD